MNKGRKIVVVDTTLSPYHCHAANCKAERIHKAHEGYAHVVTDRLRWSVTPDGATRRPLSQTLAFQVMSAITQRIG